MPGFRLLLPVVLLALCGCKGGPECSNEIGKVLLSPDGSKKLVVFSRDCGATTGFNTQVTLLGAGDELPDKPGNVFVADSGEAKVRWENEEKVVVEFEGSTRFLTKETRVRGVAFEYRGKN